MSSLLAPLGKCAERLNPKVVQPLLAPGMEVAVKFVQNLSDNDLKDKVQSHSFSIRIFGLSSERSPIL